MIGEHQLGVPLFTYMAEEKLKIAGIGDVNRSEFILTITDPDKFKQFASELGWGNKRRLLAWKSLQDYATGVLNGDINEINDMHQVVDDTGARTNKKEKYNLIGSKFDANGSIAYYMNNIAKNMKPKEETLKELPKTTDYLTNSWFGGNSPDWTLFLKNDVANKNGVYSITNRTNKLKEGLLNLYNELNTNSDKYNWRLTNKETYLSNLLSAINNPNNVAIYAPLGINSEFLNNALSTRDLSNSVVEQENTVPTKQTLPVVVPLLNITLDIVNNLSDLERAAYLSMTPELLSLFINQKKEAISILNLEILNQLLASIDSYKLNKYNLDMLNWYKTLNFKPEYSVYLPNIYRGVVANGNLESVLRLQNLGFTDLDFQMNSPRLVNAIATSTAFKTPNIRTIKTNNGYTQVTLKNKLDVLAYMLDFQSKNSPSFKELFTDVSSYIGKPKGTIYRIDKLKGNDGSYVYIRKNGSNYEFYRSKPMSVLYKLHLALKHRLGGIIAKYLQGGAEAYIQAMKLKRLLAQKLLKLTLELLKVTGLRLNTITPIQTNRDLDKLRAGRRELGSLNNLTSADYAQLGGIALDIASTAASLFGPVGNVAGAGLGLGGTAAHAYADFADSSVSAGEALTNLGTNLAFDTLGAIPLLGSYGKLAKLGRVGKALLNNMRLYNGLMTAFAAPGIYLSAPNAATAMKKLFNNPSSITADELRDLATATAMLTGATKGIAGSYHKTNKLIKENPRLGQSVLVHTNRGDKKIPIKLYEAMMDKTKNPTMLDRNEALAAATGILSIKFDNGLFHNYKPLSWNPTSWGGGIRRINNTSDPELTYLFKPIEVVKRANRINKTRANLPTITNNPELPVRTYNVTPELLKKDIELLKGRFSSKEPLPITNAVRKAYERYKKRPMSDLEIIEIESQLRTKRNGRTLTRETPTYELLNAARREALLEKLAIRTEVERNQQALEWARGNTRLANLPSVGERLVTPESVRAQANREYALASLALDGTQKAPLQGAAYDRKLKMYEKLFPPFAEIVSSGPPQHPSRRTVQARRLMEEAINLEFLNRQRVQNAVILHPTLSLGGMYLQMFGPTLLNLNSEARAMGMRAKPSAKDVSIAKALEYKLALKQARAQKAEELLNAFNNNTLFKGHRKNTNLPHKKSNKLKKTSRDNKIKRRQEGGTLDDFNLKLRLAKGGSFTIKALLGTKLPWYSKITAYDPSKYISTYNTSKLYAGDTSKGLLDAYTSNQNGLGVNRYIPTQGNDRITTLGIEGQLYYKNFTNDLLDSSGNFTNVGKIWALSVDKLLPQNSKASFFDENGNLRTSWTTNNNDVYGRSGKTYNTLSEYVNAIRNDNILGARHNVFARQGTRYFYKDNDGKQVWVDPEVAKNYNINKTGIATLDGMTTWTDYEITGPTNNSSLKTSITTPDIGKKSIFDGVKKYLSNVTSNPGSLYNAVETGKYLLSLKANNDIFKIKMPSMAISPKHASYQVMDNLALLNVYHQLAANTINSSFKPLTSSGQLQAAIQLEGMNNANKLHLLGAAERNTWLESLRQLSNKTALYNMENAVNTANTNKELAYKTRLQNDYIDARDKIRGKATNIQNYINALEKFNVIDPYVERKNAQLQYALAKAQWDYLNDPTMTAASNAYQLAVKRNQNNVNWNAAASPEYKLLLEAQRAATAKLYNSMYSTYGIKNPQFKKGGKFEDVSMFNTKEFYNTVKHSINTSTKQGGDLNKILLLLIKKSNKK